MSAKPEDKARWPGKPAADMRADAAADRDRQPVTQRCLFCRWKWTGLVGAGRIKALAHREKAHPETIGRKTYRKPGSSRGWRRRAGDDVIEGQRRAREEREEAERLATIERGRIRRGEAA